MRFIFWRLVGSTEIHIINRDRLFCGQYANTDAKGWIAVGETPDFATCPMCLEQCFADLFGKGAGFTEVKLKS